MTNSADPDQLAASEAKWSGSTLYIKAGHLGSAEPGLKPQNYNFMYPKYLDRQAWANGVDLDQTLQNVASEQILPHIQQFFDTSRCGKMDLFKIQDKYQYENEMCPNN